MYYRFENVARYLGFRGKFKTKQEVVESLEEGCAYESTNFIISTDKPNFIVIKRDARDLGGKVNIEQINTTGVLNIIKNNPFRIMFIGRGFERIDRRMVEDLVEECIEKNLYLAGTLFVDNELQAFVLNKAQKYIDNITKVKVIPKINKFGLKDKIYKSIMLWINDEKYLDKIVNEINTRCNDTVAKVTNRINDIYCIEVNFFSK